MLVTECLQSLQHCEQGWTGLWRDNFIQMHYIGYKLDCPIFKQYLLVVSLAVHFNNLSYQIKSALLGWVNPPSPRSKYALLGWVNPTSHGSKSALLGWVNPPSPGSKYALLGWVNPPSHGSKSAQLGWVNPPSPGSKSALLGWVNPTSPGSKSGQLEAKDTFCLPGKICLTESCWLAAKYYKTDQQDFKT